MNWNDAEENCKQWNGNLVSFANKEEEMKHLELDMKEEMKEDLLDFRKQMRKMMQEENASKYIAKLEKKLKTLKVE